MKVAIIEDEIPAAEKLERYLSKYDHTIEVVARLTSVQEAIAWLAIHQPSTDLIFMDIQLQDGLSFQIFNEVKVEKPVIFTTAFDEYALDAFKVNSIDYLLKPITFADLSASLQKLKALREQLVLTSEKSDRLGTLFADNKTKLYKNRFMVKIGDHIKSIITEHISLFFADGRDVYLVTTQNRKFIIDYTLEGLEDIVDPSLFFRPNRTFLIHINAIKDVLMYSNSRLKISVTPDFDKEIIVSRERVSAFKEWFDGVH